ncbi:unnamed protein product [Macrosiphum euphorbiae]|uniref:CCHC-type domain-containing protein n=1 Tax=Macrosiphum euphorbiae TaxID=13131 RepID=A0AAV0WIT0_9HEMI|nr:unnamed protein product [Macrosiphum euphorbiae]
MKTRKLKNDGTDTVALETTDPAGVGKLATPVVITSLDYTQTNSETDNLDINDTDMKNNRHCYFAPLRLRGGGDNELDNTDSNSTSGDMGAGGSQKRGPTSPGGLPAKLPRTSETSEINDLIGFLEQTVLQEKDKKKLGVMVAEKMLTKIARLRTVTQSLAHENYRLVGELKGKDDALNQSLTVFIGKLEAKNAETCGLSAELEALKTTASQDPCTAQQPSYASKAAKAIQRVPRTETAPKPTAAPQTKSRNTVNKEQMAKSRKTKATSRFLIEIPQDMTVASAKAGLWQAVRAKCSNPKAKIIVSGKSLVIIPDDANTLEVIRSMNNFIEIGPRKPRVIIYDVDGGISKDELTECLLAQNAELGITAEDMGNSVPLHKLGPRNGDAVHWVMEVPPSVLAKMENKLVYIGMTRCRCKLHSTLPQCYNCQQYGHTSARCEQKTPSCRNCAGPHDSRTCNEDGVKCVNCKGPHKASSGICKARGQATRSLLRRTDFGSPQ